MQISFVVSIIILYYIHYNILKQAHQILPLERQFIAHFMVTNAGANNVEGKPMSYLFCL